MAQKRERGINFSREETNLLIHFINENRHIIENKKSDAVTWAEKENCWKTIEANFNSASSVQFRSAKALKIKYDGIKRETRKKSAAIRSETYRTGGGTSSAPILTPNEEKVKSMISLSVEGVDSVLDCDQTPATVLVSSQIEVEAKPQSVESNLTLECKRPNEMMVTAKHKNKNLPQTVQENVSYENIEEKVYDVEHLDVETNKESCWKPAALQAKKHPALCKRKSKRPIEKMAESRMQLVELQKQMLKEEYENKRRQWLFEEEERQHKRAMWALEKQLMQKKLHSYFDPVEEESYNRNSLRIVHPVVHLSMGDELQMRSNSDGVEPSDGSNEKLIKEENTREMEDALSEGNSADLDVQYTNTNDLLDIVKTELDAGWISMEDG